jgi:methylated-DNA-[protein]-cysteine S-methyltransferase
LYSGVPRQLAYTSEGWGVGEVVLEGELLLWHELPRPGVVAGVEAHPLTARLARFFAGEQDDFLDVEIDLDEATPFQRAVAEALRRIPYGQVVTYGELAALAGHPGAHRAVGSFCAHNRFAVVVPCHRVVSADGIGPYGSLGTDYKRRLLALEGASL